MKIKINSVIEEITSYNKTITFEYEGEEYSGVLSWDNYDGYNLELDGKDDPDWITEWDEEHSLEYLLDELSDKVKEAK